MTPNTIFDVVIYLCGVHVTDITIRASLIFLGMFHTLLLAWPFVESACLPPTNFTHLPPFNNLYKCATWQTPFLRNAWVHGCALNLFSIPFHGWKGHHPRYMEKHVQRGNNLEGFRQ